MGNIMSEMSARSSENRNFRMHPALLWSVIQSQAGTPEKALLEAVMNAVDAGATRCDITLDGLGYQVEDDGAGFQNKQEIEDFFETFGTPHKEGDATYGKFRMGRGQLFAFSKTQWRSSTFSMDVNIKNKGLSYDLCCDLPDVPGCTIAGQWYEPVDMGEVIRIRHDLAQLAQWMQITVRVNGKQINKRPEDQTWTTETPDAYIAAKAAGGLAVYNLGALVRIYPAHQFGMSGIIVTKTRLQVNFARNDILLSECQAWKRIRRELDKMCENLTKKRSLYDYERDAIAQRFVRGEIPFRDVKGVGLIIDVSGKKRSLLELAAAEKVCLATSHEQWLIGERVMNQGLAFVLRSQTLDRFGVETPGELLALLQRSTNIQTDDAAHLEQLRAQHSELRKRKNVKGDSEYHDTWDQIRDIDQQIRKITGNYPYRGKYDHIKVVQLAEVAVHINDRYELLQKENLSPHQLAFLKALQQTSDHVAKHLSRYRYWQLPADERDNDPNGGGWAFERQYRLAHEVAPRKAILGKSDVATAWTDGETYVAITVEAVNEVLKGDRTLSSLVSIIYHEYCHNETDVGGHEHNPDFYELFHALACGKGGFEIARHFLLSGYAKAIADLGKKPNANMMRELKHEHKLGQRDMNEHQTS